MTVVVVVGEDHSCRTRGLDSTGGCVLGELAVPLVEEELCRLVEASDVQVELAVAVDVAPRSPGYERAAVRVRDRGADTGRSGDVLEARDDERRLRGRPRKRQHRAIEVRYPHACPRHGTALDC